MGLIPHPVDVVGAILSLSMTWRKGWMLSVVQCAHSAYEFCTSWQRRVEERKKGCEGGEERECTLLLCGCRCTAPKLERAQLEGTKIACRLLSVQNLYLDFALKVLIEPHLFILFTREF